MIPREYIKKYAFVIITIIHVVRSEDSRVYDTNEWVPIDKRCPTCERSPRHHQDTDKQPNDRVLNVNEKLGQPIEKISSYLPSRHLPKRQQLFNPNAPRNIRQQLNEGEIVNQQFYKPQIHQHVPPPNNREYPAQLPQLLQNSNQQPQPIFPPQLLPPPEQQYYLQNQQFIPPPLIPNPGNINYFQRNYNNFPVANPPKYNLKNQSLPFGYLNPGIDIINQELASGPLANNNNYNNLIHLTKPVPPKPQAGNENVQLVYVPIESLNQKQQQANQQVTFAASEELPKQQQQQHRFQQNLQFNPQNQLNAQSNNQFNFPHAAIQNNLRPQSLPLTQERLQPLETSQVSLPNRHNQPSVNQNESPSEHKQHQLQNIQNDFARQALDALKLQLSFDQGEAQPQVQLTSTTPQTPTNLSKKRKPHQPPLAVYMGGEGDVSVSDVLNLLKNAKTISVQDEVGPNSPQVFVGPNNLEAPDGFTKFELPYLNTVESNRIERKVEQLPFFVAPANYKTPNGYSKIPLPAPHVGSVVISDSERQIQQLQQQQQQPQFSFENSFNNNYQTPISYQNRQPNPIRNDNVNQAPRKTPDQTISNSYRNPLPNNPSPIQYSSTIRPDPLGQTINQYELEQINNQFVPQFLEHNQSEFQLTDEEIDKYVQNNYNNRNSNNRSYPSLLSNHQYVTETTQTTTELPKLQPHRGRPTHRLQASTQSIVEKDKYTILEDFSVNDDNVKTTTQQSYGKSLVQPSQAPIREFRPTVIPESNHFDIQFRPIPEKIEYQQPPQLHQPIAAELIQSNPIPNQYQNSNTYFQLTNNGQYVPLENVNQNSFRPIQQDYRQELITEKPSDSFTTPTTFNIVNIPTTQESVTQNVERTTSATSKLRSRGKVHHVSQTYNDPSEGFNDNGENYKLSEELPSINPNLHNLINNLQDQSLRPLLVPASIAPTTEHISFNSPVQQQKLPNQYEELAPIQYQPTKPPRQYEELAPIQYQSTKPPHQYEEIAPIQRQPTNLPTQYEELAPIQHQSTKLPVQYEEIAPIQHQTSYTIVSPPEVQSTSVLPITRFLSTTTESTPIETTTAYKRPRGRRTRVTTTTYSPPVRSSQRTRKPSSRTRPPQIKQQSEEVDYSSSRFNNQARDYENDYTPKVTRRPSTQQRFRSRGRPTQEVEVTQRTTTVSPTESEYITQSSLQSRVQLSSTSHQQPQSYMQFEQPIESAVQSKLTYSNENNNNPIQSTEKQYYTSESLSSSNPTGTNQQQLSVDVLINHPVVDSNIKELHRPDNVQYEQLNIQNEPSTSTDFIVEKSSSTTRSHFRKGGRVRVKPKTTTPIPPTSTRYEKPVVKEKDEEFYGFIRTPNFNKPKHIQAQSKSSTNEPKLYSSTYVSTTRRPLLVPVGNGEPIQYENEPKYSNDVQIHPNSFASSTPNIEFVGKIKPKYVLTTPLINDDTVTSTTEYVPDRRYSVHATQSTSTFKPKVRARMRIPNKKLYSQRGASHFKPPTSIKNNSEDEDVEGGNYPVTYLKGQDIKTEKPKFQITIDPDDQIPYSSIYRPQFVKSFDKQNNAVMERKIIESQESQSNEYVDNLKKEKNLSTNTNKLEENSLRELSNINSTEESNSATVTTLPVDTTTLSESEEGIELTTTTTERERRRGTWRLVKRPIDPLEGSESQNIASIIANNFILDPQKNKNTDKYDHATRSKDEPLLEENEKSVVKKSEAPIEITTIPSSDTKKSNTNDNTTSQSNQENILHSILNMFGLENKGDQKLSLKNIEDINKEFNSVEITSTDEDFTTPPPETTTLPVVGNSKPSEVETKFPNSDSTILNKTETTDETELNSFENPSNKIQIKTLKSDLLDANLLHQTTTRAETQTPNFEAIKTSLSTEVSHETEICYRGKCIKTKGIKKAHAL